MNYLDQNQTKSGIVSLIPDEKILTPGSIPVKIYIQEAENLYSWCQADREKLTANGLRWDIVDDMPARIDALREAQARWTTSDSSDIEIEKLWAEKAPAAHAFRNELLRTLKFAFRNDPVAISKVNRLSEGKSNAAMIQSLRDISVFGQEHVEFLGSANFDITTLDMAAEMSRQMASLMAAVNTRRAFSSDSLKFRNQAYTHLREAVTEIKDYANFVLWHDPARLKGYTSEYYRKLNLRSKNRKKIKAAESLSA